MDVYIRAEYLFYLREKEKRNVWCLVSSLFTNVAPAGSIDCPLATGR